MRRGLTLLELLAALALLSALAIAAAGLVQTAARSAADWTDQGAWRAAAEQALDVIASDLSTGDFDTGGPDAPSRVQATNNMLHVPTRDIADAAKRPKHHAAVAHQYRLDESTGNLVQDTVLPDQPEHVSHVLVGKVRVWKCVVEKDRLCVELQGDRGAPLHRSFRLP